MASPSVRYTDIPDTRRRVAACVPQMPLGLIFIPLLFFDFGTFLALYFPCFIV